MTGVDDARGGSGADGQVEYDWSEGGEPSVAVVEAVAVLTDCEVTALPPLSDHVDPDALDTLLTEHGRPSNDGVVVRFDYDGTTISVRADGTLTARTTVE